MTFAPDTETGSTPLTVDALSNLLDELISTLFLLNEGNNLDGDTIVAVAELAFDARLALDGELDPEQGLPINHAALREELSDLLNDVLSEQERGALTDEMIASLVPIVDQAIDLLPTDVTPRDPEKPIEPRDPILPPTTEVDRVLLGDDSDDALIGNQANNLARGQAGNDVIRGKGGDDRLFGNAGNDLLAGARGNDQLNGGAGSDTLLGGRGDDSLFGGRGKDVLFGARGDDTLIGGRGADTLIGGAGDDVLTGGLGDDIFIATTGSGTDQITDFEQGLDQIDLSATGLGFEDLSFSTIAGDTLITVGDSFLLVTGISAFTQDDFIF